MSDEIASAALQRVLGINKSVLSELAQRGIVKRGSKRGSYRLEASVNQRRHAPSTQRAREATKRTAGVRIRLMLSLGIVLGVAPFAQAQDVGDVPMGEIGDPQAGFEYAQATCAPCHAIGEEKSPNPKAPTFKGAANTPGMTPTALMVWLQNANHPTMPNIMIRGQELRNVAAYILSLKD